MRRRPALENLASVAQPRDVLGFRARPGLRAHLACALSPGRRSARAAAPCQAPCRPVLIGLVPRAAWWGHPPRHWAGSCDSTYGSGSAHLPWHCPHHCMRPDDPPPPGMPRSIAGCSLGSSPEQQTCRTTRYAAEQQSTISRRSYLERAEGRSSARASPSA